MGSRCKKPEPTQGWRHSWRAKLATQPLVDDRRVREAFQLILRRAEDCNANILPNTGRDGTERFVQPVLQLAQLWKRWQRAACSWEPQARAPHDQFRELSRHLLASYPVPQFMDAVFQDASQARYQEWFAHLGAGRNIRTAPGMTAVLTGRMAHYMLEAPATYSVLGALRLGQVLGLGGKAALAKAVIESSLGAQLNSPDDEAFWLTFLQWLVNHPELPRGQIGPVVDFVRARRYREPEFAMKGRTVPAVLRLMHGWHEELRRAPGIGFRALPRSGVASDWMWVAGDGKRWLVAEVPDTMALHAEGQAMHHCVYSYASLVLAGQCSIWSVQVQVDGPPERVLTVEVRNTAMKIVQARGLQNRSPTKEERQVLTHWAQAQGLQFAI